MMGTPKPSHYEHMDSVSHYLAAEECLEGARANFFANDEDKLEGWTEYMIETGKIHSELAKVGHVCDNECKARIQAVREERGEM